MSSVCGIFIYLFEFKGVAGVQWEADLVEISCKVIGFPGPILSGNHILGTWEETYTITIQGK